MKINFLGKTITYFIVRTAFFAIKVMDNPRATMKSRKAIHKPWLLKRGINNKVAGRNTPMAEISMVLRMARAAVAPMYTPSQRKAAKVMSGMAAR